jgi:hypothetical protein
MHGVYTVSYCSPPFLLAGVWAFSRDHLQAASPWVWALAGAGVAVYICFLGVVAAAMWRGPPAAPEARRGRGSSGGGSGGGGAAEAGADEVAAALAAPLLAPAPAAGGAHSEAV